MHRELHATAQKVGPQVVKIAIIWYIWFVMNLMVSVIKNIVKNDLVKENTNATKQVLQPLDPLFYSLSIRMEQ